MVMYIETAKECPKCHQKTLFFCTIVTKVGEHRFEGKLGVRCNSCGYKAEVEQVNK